MTTGNRARPVEPPDGPSIGAQYAATANLEARIDLHDRFSTATTPWLRWVFEHFDLPPTARVLEIGCGLGRLWRDNADRVAAGWSLTLTDSSAAMVEHTRVDNSVLPCALTLAVAEAADLPFSNDTFDVVVANHMLYHVPDLHRVLREVVRVLRTDDRFFATANGAAHLREVRELVARVAPGSPTTNRNALAFGAETGGPALGRWFCSVDMSEERAALEVTDADALTRYIRSTARGRQLSKEALGRMTGIVRDEISRTGSFHVTRHAVLFLVPRPALWPGPVLA